MVRADFAFPFRVDPASGRAATTDYGTHVEQMIWQILLTDPGERVDLPTFGCGLRRLLFAPNSDALQATAKVMIQQSLSQWLGDQIQVQQIDVSNGPDNDPATLFVSLQYLLIETQTAQVTLVQLP